MGWRDSSDSSSRASEALDLHTLLDRANERSPFILVGASRGELLIREYLAEYPQDVVGLVFVDPSTEDRLFTMLNGEGVLIASLTADQVRSMLPRQPVPVPRRNPQTGAPFDKLPPELYRQRVILDTRLIASIPTTMTPEMIGAAQERERAMLARLLATRSASRYPFGDRPTVVLSRGDETNAGREAVHAALANLSPSSRHPVVARAGHEIHLFEPSAVVEAVTDVLQAIRDKKPLPQR